MAEIEIKSAGGKTVGKHKVSEAISLASSAITASVVHRAIVVEQANERQGTQSARTRSEVRGGGRKPYKQKKTGNARQGTTRAPHYAHGGMALAVKPRDYSKKINRKERRQAIIAAFSQKLADENVVVAEAISFAAPRTKDALNLLTALGVADVRRVLVVVAEYDENVLKSFRNLPNVEVRTAPSRDGKASTFSTRDLVVAHKIVISADALKKTEEAWTA
ncbi:MAG: 50S ribosomal protein L4 [Fimbriimonadaceae bacterium]|jgi:large subunit ribosomal protein L4|nr:50S ribosomal protein L4 [Fimbriimonadaceae bacterium]